MSKYDALHPVKTLEEYIQRVNTGWKPKPGEVVVTEFDPSTIPVGNQTEAMRRKATPVGTGFVDYFPLAMQEVAKISLAGQKQHGLDDGGPLRWARELSADESDALMRHYIERGTLDTDGLRHTAKMAWRAMALLEKELENDS